MISDSKSGVYLDLHVQPKARQPGLRGIHGDRLKVAVSEPAEAGRANGATIAAICQLMGVGKGAVTIVAGQMSRRKRVHVEGVDSTMAQRLISVALGDGTDAG